MVAKTAPSAEGKTALSALFRLSVVKAIQPRKMAHLRALHKRL